MTGWLVVCVGATGAWGQFDDASRPPSPAETLDVNEPEAPADEPTLGGGAEMEEEEGHPVEGVPVAAEEDGEHFEVTGFVLKYTRTHPQLPGMDEVGKVSVRLTLTATGYVKPRAGWPTKDVVLGSYASGGEWFHKSAILEISKALVAQFNKRGYIGVFVGPDPEEIDEDWEDQRDEAGPLTLLIEPMVVSQLRTLGGGDRVPFEERINHPLHTKVKGRSPVRPVDQATETSTDLLRKDLVEDYLFRLNRHPGRRVSVAVSAAEREGAVTLDYLVSENNPWLVYAQVSNTGTEQTDEWRERIGFVDNQLTNNDDVLTLDFITAAFDESNAFVGAYEAPFGDSEDLRWRVSGTWSEFTASDVGNTDTAFSGTSWSAGGELVLNIIQVRDFFADFLAGVEWKNVFVDNVARDGRSDFFIPHVGLRAQRVTDITTFNGNVSVEWNMPDLADTKTGEDLNNLGRQSADHQWTAVKWNTYLSTYLEPLLNRKAWEDPSRPRFATLAHELALSFKGQHVLGDQRLIAQEQQVVGGLYTVRGYRESAVSGDTALIGSAEYRFHLPRVFKVQQDPSKTALFGKPFRFSPQQPYGRTDWDLIFRGFFDIGRSENGRIQSTEENEVLMGAGGGVEFLFKQNFSFRVDWGVALRDAAETTEGSSQVHLVATFLY